MSFKADKCLICDENREGYVCFHHLKTRKAYPEFTNEAWNLMPLCKFCHATIHNNGLSFVANKYDSVMKWLYINNWDYNKYYGRWEHE